jgi:hypothetical protein
MMRLFNIWKPGAYHGRNIKEVFFEGWYYKIISPDMKTRLAIIPGVFHHPEPDKRHAFIQVLDGISSNVTYHRYPFSEFKASRSAFDLQVGTSHFSSNKCKLDIQGQDQVIKGTLEFLAIKPWPITLLSPGVMGPYGFVPFMQTYHGVLSLDHEIVGVLSINDQSIHFQGGKGYIEKDWGTTFPRAYIWMQSNHFPDQKTSITASVATIPWLGSWFRGFLIGLQIDGKLFRFTTYLGSYIQSLRVTDQYVVWDVVGKSQSDPERQYPNYLLNIRAKRGTGGLLSSPELDGMTPRILESLTANIDVTLSSFEKDGLIGTTIFKGNGICAGLEVAGSIEEITDQTKKEEKI